MPRPTPTEPLSSRDRPHPGALLPSKAELDDRIKQERSAVLLVNTRSRRGRELFESSRRLLAREGYEVSAAFPIGDGGLLQAAVEDALALRPSLLIVGSGDGTIGTVVDHLAYRDIALGLLPLGTTNNFARTVVTPDASYEYHTHQLVVANGGFHGGRPIAAEPPRSVEVDGEIQAVTPIDVKVAHNALRVMAPESFLDL